jgi:hypothetical protein
VSHQKKKKKKKNRIELTLKQSIARGTFEQQIQGRLHKTMEIKKLSFQRRQTPLSVRTIFVSTMSHQFGMMETDDTMNCKKKNKRKNNIKKQQEN